jgi:hypothetical protein
VKVLLLHAELVESKRDDLGMGPVKLGVGKERRGAAVSCWSNWELITGGIRFG